MEIIFLNYPMGSLGRKKWQNIRRKGCVQRSVISQRCNLVCGVRLGKILLIFQIVKYYDVGKLLRRVKVKGKQSREREPSSYLFLKCNVDEAARA